MPYNDYAKDIDLKSFQPEVSQVKQRIKNHEWKKRWLRNAIDIAAAGAILGWAYSKFSKK